MLTPISKIVNNNTYRHIACFDPNDVLRFVNPDADPITVTIDGIEYRTNVNSLRLQCFKRSLICVDCGLTGSVICLDSFWSKSVKGGHHFNLYAEKDGESILMTKDHIIPKSKNGHNHLSNLQTMCSVCNSNKGNQVEKVLTVDINDFIKERHL